MDLNSLDKKVTERVEQTYVRQTYDHIADDFDRTRYKKWPRVDEFLSKQCDGSLLLDVGCGNGKYLNNASTYNIGCDISANLLSICRRKKFEVVQCDMTRLPFRESTFDVMISIASLHHIVGEQRRRKCVEDMLQLLVAEQHCGKLLIQVWSYEQDLDKANPYLKRSIIEEEANRTRDVSIDDKTTISMSVHKNRTPFKSQDVLVPFKVKCDEAASSCSQHSERAEAAMREHLRYYHVFKEDELPKMIESIACAKRMDYYHDRGNWCAVLQRTGR